MKIIIIIVTLLPVMSWGQVKWSSPATVASRPELVLFYSTQSTTTGRGYQDVKIICKNNTIDKIAFKITYEVHFHHGEVERVSSNSVIELKPGETFDPKSVADWGGVYKRFFLTPTGGKYGAKENWFAFGKDSHGNQLYSAISSVMNMKITYFVNFSQRERDEKEKLEREEFERKNTAKSNEIEGKGQDVGSSNRNLSGVKTILDVGDSKLFNSSSKSSVVKGNNINEMTSFGRGLQNKNVEEFNNDKGETFQKDRSNQDNTFFLYAKGSSARFRDEKILLVSSHIISFFNDKQIVSLASLSLAFKEAVNKIERDESLSGAASYYNIGFEYPIVEYFIGKADIHYSDLRYDITDEDSKLSAIEKKRRGIINEYMDEGYKVYQVYFNPLNYPNVYGGNNKDDKGAPLVFQPRSKLSEVWIPPYISGEIKQRMNILKEKEGGLKKDVSTTSSGRPAKDNCQSTYVIQLTQNLESSYSSYKNMQMPIGSRDKLIEDARNLLFLCPNNFTARNILNSLELEVELQTEIIRSMFDNSIKYEIEFARSIFFSKREDLVGEKHIGNAISMIMKQYYGIPEISFIIGAGVSKEQYPNYEFRYSGDDSRFQDDFPKSGQAFDVGDQISLNAGLGLGGVVPIIKNRKSAIPRLGIAFEGLGFLKYGFFENMIVKSHFPDLQNDFTWALRGRTGLLIGCGDNFGITLNYGFEKFFIKESVESTIQNLNDENEIPIHVKYEAKVLNKKTKIPFVGLSLVF